jgi:glycosyltransferase involved in cell wall biosynthesis
MFVIFSHAHPSLSKGGAEVSAYALYLGLRRQGRPVAFVAMAAEADAARATLETDGEYLLVFDPLQYDHQFHHAPPTVFEAARQLLHMLQPTHLVFHHFLFLGINTIGRLIAEHACPSAVVLHEFLAICQHHGQMVTRPQQQLCLRASPSACAACFPEQSPDAFNVRRAVFLAVLRQADRLISPSRFLAQRFVEWGVDGARLSVIENGLAGHQRAPRWDPARATGPLGAMRPPSSHAGRPERRQTVFGYFGQINPFKGLDRILDALDQIRAEATTPRPPLLVRVHGNLVPGMAPEFLARFHQAAGPGGAVEYAGAYQNSDVLHLMGGCDYVLMGSKWWENSPVVIQEAYAARRPVIVPNLGGMAEKVTHGVSGWHFAHDDPRDLARVLLACAAEHAAGGRTFTFPDPPTAEDMAVNYLAALRNSADPAAPEAADSAGQPVGEPHLN